MLWNLTEKPHTALVTILEAQTTPIADPLGQVSHGFIKFRGQLAKDLVGRCKHGSACSSKGAHTLDDDMMNPYRFVLVCKFDTAIDVDMPEIYCLPIFEVPIISISITDNVNKRLGLEDLSGLLLVPTSRVPGEFQRCGTVHSTACGEEANLCARL